MILYRYSTILIFTLLVGTSVQAQDSLSLEKAKSLAIANNIKLTNSRLEIEAAKKALEGTKIHYYPQVSADGFLMYAVDPLMEINSEGGDLPVYDGNPDNLSAATQYAYIPPSHNALLQQIGAVNLGISQPIYTGGKIKLGNKMAAVQVDIREEQKKLSEKELLLNVEQQYWQIIALQEKQKTIEDFRRLLDRLYIQVNDAYKSGLIIRNDVYKIDLELSNLDLNESKLKNGKELALRQFSNTLGFDYDSITVLIEDLDDYQPPEYYLRLDNEYITGLSEVKLLEKSIDLEKLQLQLNEAGNKPTVAAGVNAFYMTQFEESTGGVNALGFLTVNMPFSKLWTSKHEIQQQKIRTEIAQNSLEDTKKLLELRTTKSWIDLKEAYEQIQIIEKRIIQANENLKINQTSYDSGVVTLSDYLEAKALQTQASDDLIEAKSKYKAAIAAYILYTRSVNTK